MIPLSKRESVTHTDEDGVIWEFVPKTGLVERQLIAMIEGAEKIGAVERYDIWSDFFNRIVKKWTSDKMPKFGENPAQYFAQEEIIRIVLEYWTKANTLTAEEKKS